MYRDGCVRVHVEQSCLNDINHLITSRSIDGDLKVGDDYPKVTSKTETETKPSLATEINRVQPCYKFE